MNFSFLRKSGSAALFVLLATLLFSIGALAQSGTSGISGTITDQAGAVVPGATVKLINPATNFERTTTANDAGRYTFSGVPAATYRIEVEAAGFNKLVRSDLKLLVDSPVEINLQVTPGDINVVVDVTSGTIESVINNQDATIGNNFVPEQIINLPTDLRRINDLLTLQPGVTREGYVAGGRSDQANITLDGVDINDQQTGGRTSQFQTTQDSALRATTESVEEFRITTIGTNANQGRSSGAQISLITKSGTNNFRGSGFYFRRPTKGSANSFFNNLAGIERPSLARDILGGAIGGPIKKDKFFFFYSYERQKQTLGTPVNRVVPLAHVAQGKIRFAGTGPSCVNGQCEVGLAELNNDIYSEIGGLNPLVLNLFTDVTSKFPSNNTIIGDGINTGGFLFNAPTTTRENTHITRLDYHLSDTQQLFFRGNYQWDNTAGVSAFPGTPAVSSWSHPLGFAVGHNWTISNNRVNNFRYGFTKTAFSNQGDSTDNSISFRFVYSPFLFARTLSRKTPVTNITDDFTWTKGNHTFQFGGNVRIIRNRRFDLGNAFDDAITNPSFYDLSGRVLDAEFTKAGYAINPASRNTVQAAAAALIGRYSQFSGNFTFDIDGSVLPVGTPTNRNFATEEYDSYIQDVWKIGRDLTLTLGLRYALSRPVYEQKGFQVVPEVRLGEVFDRRVASAATGVPLNELINFRLGGPKNNAPGFYSLDKNNWQPRIAAAWSPHFENGFLSKIFGANGESTLRGGFGISNDFFGGQLAVSFDGLSPIGFTSSDTISANTFNVTDRPAPLFTGFGQDIRSLPGISAPVQRFTVDADEEQRIETSLDATIVSPKHYTWNVSYGRRLPKDMYFEASYVGRAARHLFAARDIFALNNIVDPASGLDWYTAAGQLVDAQRAGKNVGEIAAIPYFENLFPNALADWGFLFPSATNNTQAIFGFFSDDPNEGFAIRDYTFIQLLIDDSGKFPNMFFHPQFGALSAFGTFAKSDYHGATFTLRQRLGETLNFDINYTFSKSFDNASGLQTGGSFGSQFILNSLRPEDNRSVSDFDTKHSVNANFLLNIPVGRGKALFGGMGSAADAVFGGWSLRGIYRFNSGLPLSAPFDAAQWATNWNVQSNGTRIRQLQASVDRARQNIFFNPQQALNSFRNARPGETGERNTLRLPHFQTLDMGLSKSVTMPWSENHKFEFRWEVFNVTNIQYFNAGNFTRSSFGLPEDPEIKTASPDFGKIFNGIQGNPRRMQFGFRYSF